MAAKNPVVHPLTWRRVQVQVNMTTIRCLPTADASGLCVHKCVGGLLWKLEIDPNLGKGNS